MSKYQELYKKYRPNTWDSLVGQEGVVSDLRNEILSKQVPTAYLFAGKQHGCGKTSAAWIMAKAVNCENLNMETGSPCNECATCKSIDAGTQPGVKYISMANNGSVKDAKSIVEQAQMAQPVNRSVWILDEAHNMSREAAEAWLIPLESSNMKALFIFCSTEPEKIIGTVKSRLQQKSFRSVGLVDIYKYLEKIAKLESMKLTSDEIRQAALEGQGSIRDALNNLEVINRDGKLTGSYKNKILSMLANKDYVKALQVSAEMDTDGQDYVKATEQLYRDFSDMLLLSAGAEPSSNATNPQTYLKFAEGIGANGLLRIIKILGDGLNSMVYNTVDNRILFEMALFQTVGVIRSATAKKGE